MISSFHYEVDENCPLLGYSAASSRNSKNPTILGFLMLEDGTERLTWKVGKDLLYTLRNSPEECSSQLQSKIQGNKIKQLHSTDYNFYICQSIFLSPWKLVLVLELTTIHLLGSCSDNLMCF